ncbi:hypothetical protein [Cupriavidus sp. CP313]
MGIIESVQQYDLNIPAGGAQNIDVAGDRVQFLSATDPFAQIEIRPNYAQGNISLKPGQGFRFSEQVTRWVVFNRGSVPLSGYLMIGSGDFFDQRVNGEVNVIDSGKSSTLAGSCFSGGMGINGTAAQYNHIILRNPAGSAKRVIVDEICGQVATRDYLITYSGTGAYGSLVRNAGNKLAGGAVSTAEIRQNVNAAAYSAGAEMYTTKPAADVFVKITPKRPIVLLPDSFVLVRSGSVNVEMTAYFDFYEEAL